MITISANTIFKVLAPTLSLQAVTAADTVQLSYSVDGVTFTNAESTFTGTQSFSENVTGLFLKVDKACYCTEPVEFPTIGTVAITVTAPSHGKIKVVDFRTKQPINLAAFPKGEKFECIWYDATTKWRFVKWTIGGVDYTDERPVIVASANATVAITLVELPR